MTHERVIANLLVANNGATSLGGTSSPLSPASDRRRFHELRAQARAILIGGNTYRNEPYSSSPLPLYVASRSLPPSHSSQVHILAQSPHDLIERAISDHGAPILIEGGPHFLQPLIEVQDIDVIHITRVALDGDSDFFDEDLLTENYLLTEQASGGVGSSFVTFQIWRASR